jgi:hypothetical protein
MPLRAHYKQEPDMNREQAEKLLAAMIFDDLDEPSKAELLAYLQTDDELRDRLTDLRMTVKLTSDAVNDGPEPVLSGRRLKQLKRLAKTHKIAARIFTMRRLMSVAAVMAFGVVLVGLLTPALNKSNNQSRKVAWEMEQRLRSLSETLESSPEVGEPRTPDYSAVPRRPASQRVARGRGDMGGYGGMAGMGDESVRNGALAAGGGIYSDSMNGLSAVQPGQASAPPSTMGRKQNAPRQFSLTAKAEEEQVAQIMSEMNGRHDMRQLATEPTTAVVSDSAPARSSDGFRDELRFRGGFSAAGSTPSGPEGMIQSYGWSGTLTPEKSAALARAPTEVDSLVSSDRKTGEALEFSVGNGADAGGKVPVLGDKPLVGQIFSESDSDVKQYAGKEISEVRKQAEAPSSVAPVQVQTVSPVPGIQPTDQVVILDVEKAGVPYSDELTYPKNWRELLAEQKTGISLATDGDGIPSPSHFQVVPVNPWVMTDRDALSTFALDVDTASYALCRRYIRSGTLPPIGAVRMEEFINAFDYAYPQRDGATFAVYAEGAPSPFAPEGQDLTLLKIAVKARTVGRDQRRPAHIVFGSGGPAAPGPGGPESTGKQALGGGPRLPDYLCQRSKAAFRDGLRPAAGRDPPDHRRHSAGGSHESHGGARARICHCPKGLCRRTDQSGGALLGWRGQRRRNRGAGRAPESRRGPQAGDHAHLLGRRVRSV